MGRTKGTWTKWGDGGEVGDSDGGRCRSPGELVRVKSSRVGEGRNRRTEVNLDPYGCNRGLV